jgi:hypothetical protein
MTRAEIRAEADQAARDFAKLVAESNKGVTGIPKPVEIIVTQTETDVEKFGLQLNPKSASATPPASGPGVPPPPPPVGCPTSGGFISIEFSGVNFDCGCIIEGVGTSYTDLITEDSAQPFNGVPVGMFPHTSACSDCMWYPAVDNVLFLHHKVFYDVAEDCTGFVASDATLAERSVVVRCTAGTWEVFVYTGHASGAIIGIALFYGTATDISSPISNSLSCQNTPVTIDNPLVNCFFGTGSGGVVMPIAAHGGSATITL